MFAAGCAAAQTGSGTDGPPCATARLAQARTWAYWLQEADLDVLAESDRDILVIDYSYNGSDAARFTPRDIRALKDKGKVVLCYLSIGEAEPYRFYWQQEWKDSPPSFMGPENEKWVGSHKVKFWTRSWWNTSLHPYLEKIFEAGFDGVYLDIVDGYWFWGEAEDRLQERASDMIRLVTRISRFGDKRTDDNFLVFIQNGLSIMDDASEDEVPGLLAAIDGAGVESVFFNGDPAETPYRLGLIARLVEQGKTVMDVEYLAPGNYAEFLEKVRASNLPILPYRSTEDRLLNSLAVQE